MARERATCRPILTCSLLRTRDGMSMWASPHTSFRTRHIGRTQGQRKRELLHTLHARTQCNGNAQCNWKLERAVQLLSVIGIRGSPWNRTTNSRRQAGPKKKRGVLAALMPPSSPLIICPGWKRSQREWPSTGAGHGARRGLLPTAHTNAVSGAKKGDIALPANSKNFGGPSAAAAFARMYASHVERYPLYGGDPSV